MLICNVNDIGILDKAYDINHRLHSIYISDSMAYLYVRLTKQRVVTSIIWKAIHSISKENPKFACIMLSRRQTKNHVQLYDVRINRYDLWKRNNACIILLHYKFLYTSQEMHTIFWNRNTRNICIYHRFDAISKGIFKHNYILSHPGQLSAS